MLRLWWHPKPAKKNGGRRQLGPAVRLGIMAPESLVNPKSKRFTPSLLGECSVGRLCPATETKFSLAGMDSSGIRPDPHCPGFLGHGHGRCRTSKGKVGCFNGLGIPGVVRACRSVVWSRRFALVCSKGFEQELWCCVCGEASGGRHPVAPAAREPRHSGLAAVGRPPNPQRYHPPPILLMGRPNTLNKLVPRPTTNWNPP